MEYANLIEELLDTLEAINKTLESMKLRHEVTRAASTDPYKNYPSFYAMQDMNGRPLAADLLSAKANLLVVLHGVYAREEDG